MNQHVHTESAGGTTMHRSHKSSQGSSKLAAHTGVTFSTSNKVFFLELGHCLALLIEALAVQIFPLLLPHVHLLAPVCHWWPQSLSNPVIVHYKQWLAYLWGDIHCPLVTLVNRRGSGLSLHCVLACHFLVFRVMKCSLFCFAMNYTSS